MTEMSSWHSPELRDYWDLSIYPDVRFEQSIERRERRREDKGGTKENARAAPPQGLQPEMVDLQISMEEGRRREGGAGAASLESKISLTRLSTLVSA